jgi:hypothetical protein
MDTECKVRMFNSVVTNRGIDGRDDVLKGRKMVLSICELLLNFLLDVIWEKVVMERSQIKFKDFEGWRLGRVLGRWIVHVSSLSLRGNL